MLLRGSCEIQMRDYTLAIMPGVSLEFSESLRMVGEMDERNDSLNKRRVAGGKR